MRINKYIAKSGFCSRRKADRLIEQGKVHINGKTATPGEEVNEQDHVTVGEHVITLEGKDDAFFVFNKPVGVISTFDPEADNSLLDYLGDGERVFYVGRLDVASCGLMLFTNNGDVANKITDASRDHEKEYVVTVDKKLRRSALDLLRNGVEIDGRMTKPARIKKMSDTRFTIIITEGRNRQIRKMCEAIGYNVQALRRVRIMNIKLGMLGAGNTRPLTKKERRELLAAL